MPLSHQEKLRLLNEVRKRKNILFGHFDDNKDGKKKKAEEWEEIRLM